MDLSLNVLLSIEKINTFRQMARHGQTYIACDDTNQRAHM